MPVSLLDLDPQYTANRDALDAAVAEIVRSQRFILGPPVERLEAAVADRVGTRHAVGCASGTDALLLPLRALGLEPGDEVIVPAFTFFATAGAVWNAGLRPIFADIEPETFNLDVASVRAAVSDRTRAVVVVHLFGQMAEMGPLLELAAEHGLYVIEDAAQAIGARQRVEAPEGPVAPKTAGESMAAGATPAAHGTWRPAGSLGTAGAFSFFPTKNLGGFGDGGMITTDDDALAERLRKLRVHGGRQMYHHEMVGTNSRLDALQAAVLSAKLPHLEEWARRRRENAAFYDERLAPLAPRVRTPVRLPHNEHVYNQYTIRAERRDELKAFLDSRGVGNGVYYPVPLHLQACFAELGYRSGDLPESERAAGEVLSLPVYPELTAAQLEEVVGSIIEFYP